MPLLFSFLFLSFFLVQVGKAAEYQQKTISYKDAIKTETEDFNPKIDIILDSENPDVKFRINRNSPYIESCLKCRESYNLCDKEYRKPKLWSDSCLDGAWMSCVIYEEASCTSLRKK